MANPMIEKLKASIAVDAARSWISVGGEEFAYHCDKFNTRIIKGLEDVLGPAKARELIMRTASQNLLEMFKSFAASTPEFQAADTAEKLTGLTECLKLLGFGAVALDKMDGSSTQARSTTSYLAEGYLENMQRWGWPVRKAPFCYDLEGYLQAAFAAATGKDLASISVTETQCRTAGADSCIFEVEVK